MDSYASHICLVSEQPLPNLIPLLARDSRPRRVALLVSDQMRDRADVLKRCLRDLGCKVSLHQTHAYRIEDIRSLVLDILGELENEPHTSPVALNVTGGTKVMALGAYDVFRQMELPAFYIDTHNRSYTRLYPEPGTVALPDLVTVDWHLRAYGYTLENHHGYQVLPERVELCRFLAQQAGHLGKTIGRLNALAARAKEPVLYAKVENHTLKEQDFLSLVKRMEELSLCCLEQDRLVFKDETARRFANGGWLESHLLNLCNELKKQGRIFNHRANVEIKTRQGIRNEFDLLFTANNRLHIIECKTGNLDHEVNKAGDTIYKLEALRDLVGGTFGRAMLVSYRNLNEHTCTRCREYGIEVVHGSQLARLRELLIAWIDQA